MIANDFRQTTGLQIQDLTYFIAVGLGMIVRKLETLLESFEGHFIFVDGPGTDAFQNVFRRIQVRRRPKQGGAHVLVSFIPYFLCILRSQTGQ